ncbi:Zinc finger, C6HC-type [Corchorus capsularis]|uniref:RBR-type E3 ubiquitin transferase n=1 Tax=Corchorus capsularis TaxID=210143 RepID=A0A1R3KZ17_COCAP|nr:Zinc finger, C6HC-type [Corchorus capsularis]
MGNKLQKPKQSKSETEEPDADFTCEICIQPVDAKNKFKNNGICKHNFCSDCIAKYIEAKVVEFNVANINCPALDCKFPLDPLSCRPILPHQLFDKWCDLLCGETVLEKYGISKRSYCPNPNCSTLVVSECNDKPSKSTCPNCKKEFCFKCQSRWHAGFRCSEKQIYTDRNDILFGKLIEKSK